MIIRKWYDNYRMFHVETEHGGVYVKQAGRSEKNWQTKRDNN